MSPRTRLLVEVAIVGSVSLGASAMYSVLRIIERLTRHVALNQQTSSINTAATPDRPWLSLLYQVADLLTLVAPVALALYLLASVRVPAEGWRGCMGLTRWPQRRDWLIGAVLFAGIGIPGLGLYLLARQLGLNTTVQAANLGEHWWTVPVLVLAAAGNGLLEEVLMVGYLFTRFRQAGLAPWVGWLVSALVRGSYHLYQGFGGFVGNLVMGLVLGSIFLRTKRVWPLVLAHFLLDVASFVGYSLLAGRLSWL
ncbi:type II CAAX endopeptidase family protein [Luteococcus sanguinis]|uniref:Type II CAAX endopeptidase family protein n=1 Tax=Luteococcus sanguinis TaxID=174038 RepID=A0ABW1X0X2_9ACTN